MAFTLDLALAAKVDRMSRQSGKNRSQFIREALAHYLIEQGEEVALQETFAPDRRKVEPRPRRQKVTFEPNPKAKRKPKP